MKLKHTLLISAATLIGAFSAPAWAQDTIPVDLANNASSDTDARNGRFVYWAKLHTLNSRVAGHPHGWARFEINRHGDKFKAQVKVWGAPANMVHVQHIHAGTKCPTMAADLNHDGFVDVAEGLPDYGPILVPLDGDLSSQEAGAMGFPSANGAGFINYHKMTSLSAMLADLHLPDPDPMDAVIKLEPGEALNLASRHVVIHGVPPNTVLPDTVQTLHGLPAQATLPIACGKIFRKQ